MELILKCRNILVALQLDNFTFQVLVCISCPFSWVGDLFTQVLAQKMHPCPVLQFLPNLELCSSKVYKFIIFDLFPIAPSFPFLLWKVRQRQCSLSGCNSQKSLLSFKLCPSCTNVTGASRNTLSVASLGKHYPSRGTLWGLKMQAGKEC